MEYLSTFHDTTDQQPNIELAAKLVASKDKETIEEIAQNVNIKLESIASDCIKVMYEIGKIEPQLISEYLDTFLELLSSQNNRMVWGAMYAIGQIAPYEIKKINDNFGKIVNAYEMGTVITKDNSIAVFAEIAKADVSNSAKAYDLIISYLKKCRPKEIPQHSEKAFTCIDGSNYNEFERVLLDRFDLMTKNQKKRVSKLITNIENGNFAA